MPSARKYRDIFAPLRSAISSRRGCQRDRRTYRIDARVINRVINRVITRVVNRFINRVD